MDRTARSADTSTPSGGPSAAGSSGVKETRARACSRPTRDGTGGGGDGVADGGGAPSPPSFTLTPANPNQSATAARTAGTPVSASRTTTSATATRRRNLVRSGAAPPTDASNAAPRRKD